MPEALAEVSASCPYCGESIELLVDGSEAEQDYIEDCFVCCRPIRVRVQITTDGLKLQLSSEDDSAGFGF